MGEPMQDARRRATVLEAAVRAAYEEATQDPTAVEGEVASLGYLLSHVTDHRSRADHLAEGVEDTMDPMVLLARRRAGGRGR
jgi:hypothetical protein